MLVLLLMAQLADAPVEQLDDPDVSQELERERARMTAPEPPPQPDHPPSVRRALSTFTGSFIGTAIGIAAIATWWFWVAIVGTAEFWLAELSNQRYDTSRIEAAAWTGTAVLGAGHLFLAPLGAFTGHRLAGGARSYWRAFAGNALSAALATVVFCCLAGSRAPRDGLIAAGIAGGIVSAVGPVIALELP